MAITIIIPSFAYACRAIIHALASYTFWRLYIHAVHVFGFYRKELKKERRYGFLEERLNEMPRSSKVLTMLGLLQRIVRKISKNLR